MGLTAEQKATWVADLRSGNRTQGREYLRLNDEFCCLGVLADELDPQSWNKYGEGAPQEWLPGDRGFSDDDSECYLPFDIIDRVTQDKLADLNDDKRKSFAEIADYIEENL